MNENFFEALQDKLVQLQKMQGHLVYSHQKVASWWCQHTEFTLWHEDQLESLAAFKGRFAGFQDHLASAMKLIATIEGKDTRLFTYILNYMEQPGIISGMNDWLAVRSLRNAATQDYADSEATRAEHFDSLLQHADYLYN